MLTNYLSLIISLIEQGVDGVVLYVKRCLMFLRFVQTSDVVLVAHSFSHNFGDFDFTIDDVEEGFAATESHGAVACGGGQKCSEVSSNGGIQI